MLHLTRAAANEKIRIAEAVNAGQAGGDLMKDWLAQQRAIAGYLPKGV